MKISIVTATYNREDKLPKLFESINKNYKKYKDIEWIIMDDGSVDNTTKLVKKWIKEVDYKIDYHYQQNKGKMEAINNAIKYVTGDIIIEIDSDDYFVDNALVNINKDYESLGNKNVYGIIYKRNLGKKDTTVDKEIDGKVITLFDIHNKYGYDFDMNLTFKADIRKKYIYEVEDSEKFVTEARLYYKLDQLYDGLLFKDKEIVIGEYLEDGYSKNINKMFKKYPFGYYEFFRECLTYIKKDTLFKKKLYFVKHYILFSYLTGKKMKTSIRNVKGSYKLWVILLIIPGYLKSRNF